MRFRGGGVGHKTTREASDFFKNDRDVAYAGKGISRNSSGKGKAANRACIESEDEDEEPEGQNDNSRNNIDVEGEKDLGQDSSASEEDELRSCEWNSSEVGSSSDCGDSDLE